MLDVDAQAAGGQIADMPEAGAHGVLAPEELFDCFGLGSRLDHHKALFSHFSDPGIQHRTHLTSQSF